MSLAKELRQIFDDLGYARCGGYCYKKAEKDLTIMIDNPFSGWDNEEDQESFIIDFSCFIPTDDIPKFSTQGKITLEFSTVFKAGDSSNILRKAENDLKMVVSKILSR